MEERKRTVIIGGGIAGLTAAYYLQKENLNMDITLVEATHRLGGKIDTLRKDGFTIERGPDSFLERKKDAKQLVEDLGLEEELVRNATGQAFILSQDRLHPIPKGSVMGIPIEIKPFVQSGLLTWSGKLAALKSLTKPNEQLNEDQSVGHFFRKRLGNQVVDRLIHPLISGIYAGDIDQLSLKATFPHYLDVEKQYGRLIKGLRQTSKTSKTEKKQGQFLTLKSGLRTLIDRLEEALSSQQVLLDSQVTHIEKNNNGYAVHIEHLDEPIEADYLVMATPHDATKKIFSQYDFMHFTHAKRTSVANVAIAFEKDAIDNLPNGTGFVVSRKESYRITACTWVHKKWPHTTPEGHVLLRAFVGKPGDEDILDQKDEEIAELVLNDLRTIMEINKPPLYKVVTRWYDAMPQYTVGHMDRLQELGHNLAKHLPNVWLTGNSYRGVGLPDCMKDAKSVVQQIAEKEKGQ
ncbi:protoporphyrinogen oxidase [Tenuibacillus multivorans]|uniref:Coproporphyrinogen III oxidase n=1 Tax=Tenuibacillus multivorans TaxID=237069 RepID=A0A1H0A3Y6_9BACI|nr:protoporphyrinogen oxidase [Tenuibacillus multivorans]GEL78375.1 protoporphyrinogen oxidase [Tenuibacillus multivorans]SDN27971.1 oxygen-dependent protoporphyrinogen oxidase [Tenuibacillus multivorans]